MKVCADPLAARAKRLLGSDSAPLGNFEHFLKNIFFSTKKKWEKMCASWRGGDVILAKGCAKVGWRGAEWRNRARQMRGGRMLFRRPISVACFSKRLWACLVVCCVFSIFANIGRVITLLEKGPRTRPGLRSTDRAAQRLNFSRPARNRPI